MGSGSLSPDWKKLLSSEFEKDYFVRLRSFLNEEAKTQTIYPPREKVFSALNLCPLEKVRVVIVGQDPYHGEGEANGLAFSVDSGIKIPPSLLNIFKEIKTDLSVTCKHGDLSSWAAQGVLLLNTCLTVRKDQAASHSRKGWEMFTDQVICKVSELKSYVVFLLWGRHAQNKVGIIDEKKHSVLTSVHPSPLSATRGFFGCRHFSRANELLVSHALDPIKWDIS